MWFCMRNRFWCTGRRVIHGFEEHPGTPCRRVRFGSTNTPFAPTLLFRTQPIPFGHARYMCVQCLNCRWFLFMLSMLAMRRAHSLSSRILPLAQSSFTPRHVSSLYTRVAPLPLARAARASSKSDVRFRHGASFGYSTGSSTNASAVAVDPISHPSFKILKTDIVEEYGAYCTLYEHERTGAQVLSVSIEDDNKVFGITFRTPPTDSTVRTSHSSPCMRS